jgi:siroheme synthase-like protein
VLVAAEPPAHLPVQLDVRGRRCVVVGAGPVGARRTATLLAAGARVLIVAPDVGPAVAGLVAASGPDAPELARRPFEPADLDGALLAVAATGSESVDAAVSRAAAARGVLVNRADRAELGDLSFPAVVRRGPVRLAVSTGGAAPAVARLVADRLDAHLDDVVELDADGLGTLVELVGEVRAQLASAAGEEGVTRGPLDWRSALDGSILDLIRQGRRAEAKERLLACLSSS